MEDKGTVILVSAVRADVVSNYAKVLERAGYKVFTIMGYGEFIQYLHTEKDLVLVIIYGGSLQGSPPGFDAESVAFNVLRKARAEGLAHPAILVTRSRKLVRDIPDSVVMRPDSKVQDFMRKVRRLALKK